MNKNITNTESWYAENIDPELDAKLDEFDGIIADTFGEEVVGIEHFIYTERTSFTTVRFERGYIGFRVVPRMVVDDTYEASTDRLRRAFEAFGIELPFWMRRMSA